MAATSTTIAAAPRAARSTDRAFYTGMAIAAAAAVLLGFARTFYLRSGFQTTPLALTLQLHGIVFSAWLVLFAIQTSLIAARKTQTHRTLGWVGAGLAGVMIVVAMSAAIFAGRRDIAAGYVEESLTFFATPVLSMVTFAILLGSAVALQKRAELHKRLMLLATVSLLDAAVARWPFPALVGTPLGYYGITDLFIVAAIAYDFVSRRSVSPVYLWGGLFIVAQQALRDVIGATPLWHAFAENILG